ncbi:glutathione S-transferase N-terminal domain-containing protein [bacterium]|nr:glutathione S-transferase N-terminal domain-containing protein [bacterium]
MLLLYKKESCPYCKKVVDFLESKNINYRGMDVSDSVNMDELLNIGGIDQVPFLVDTDNNIKMYESQEIIKYVDAL